MDVSVKKQLCSLYKARCMLTGIKGPLTYHHIIKVCDGGYKTVSNGAMLREDAHQWLHNDMEVHHEETFDLLNECMQLYKACVDEGKLGLVTMYEEEIMPKVCSEVKMYTKRRGKYGKKRPRI